ncbi:hypothetical protein PoB_001920100 [Plakobranchus ocellatus]|uniref:Uncharacterized protein n=1 Tax=Plakobranchus ocellatus TaxID=259542 RepID=A0AAV3ZDI0_9GAST|nr:hypothetical protein PoB_001920100 [Plakobranchus ocellatus]
MIPACPPAPVKQHKFCSRVNKDSLEDEPACGRRLNLQDDDHLNLSIQQYLRMQIPLCTRTSHLPLTKALAPKKNCGVQKVSLKHNKGILARPFQSRARRNILKKRDPKNIVRIKGVDDPRQNWINLDTINSFPINRAGNPPAPAAPRKAKIRSSKFQNLSKKSSPKRLEFLDSVGDCDKEAGDSGYESPNHVPLQRRVRSLTC